MYIDAVVVFCLVIVALVCIMAIYLSVYACKHLRVELEREDTNGQQCGVPRGE